MYLSPELFIYNLTGEQMHSRLLNLLVMVSLRVGGCIFELLKNETATGRSNRLAGRELALQVANRGSVPSIPYGAPGPER